MKTKPLVNGDTLVWYGREEEFLTVKKNQPLYDTIIDANLLEKKYSRILVDEIQMAGLDEIHGVLLDIDDMLQSQIDTMKVNELDLVFNQFNDIFHTDYKYYRSSDGLVSITLTHFENYPEFVKDYFGAFILKLFACKIDIIKSEEGNHELQGLTEFISKFAPEYMKIYLETSRNNKFAWVIQIE